MKIQIFDSEGTELKSGDLIKLQQERNSGFLTFYTRIKVKNGTIFPLNKFCFDRILKIESIPKDCTYCPEDKNGYEYWMHPRQELHFIEKEELEKWKWDYMKIESNSFIKILD